MARTPSTMVALGSAAADFRLLNPANNQQVARDDLRKSKGLLVIFMCNHCPFVKHILEGLRALGRDYHNSEIGLVAISSNDAEQYPDDAPEKMPQLNLGITYLYDETQQVAKAYDAACTPDFFLYDGDLQLVYRGQFDDARPGNDIPVTGKDLRAAMDALLEGKSVSPNQVPSLGCNIKWK
ncbi:thioredoxin family protein [Cellvibrio sp. ARAG 10.3]|uniref:thioredoxin family protein n=1 Tax=Cellvibrio sp. ARAG 10.3 TaxID=3451358 RepID=UPI003F46C666